MTSAFSWQNCQPLPYFIFYSKAKCAYYSRYLFTYYFCKNAQKNCTKKGLNDPDNHNGVVIPLEPDFLECEVKWALGSITMNKDSEGDGIPVELFQILKDDAVKVLQSLCQQIWKPQQWPQDQKRSVFIPIPKKCNAKEYSNYLTIALISHTSKVMFKILQARLPQQ